MTKKGLKLNITLDLILFWFSFIQFNALIIQLDGVSVNLFALFV